MARSPGYGEWLWIHDADIEPQLQHRVAGRTSDGSALCLPPAFAADLKRLQVVDHVNRRCGTLLDWYEEEDIGAAEVLGFIAGFVDAAFPSTSESRPLAEEVVAFLLSRAASHRMVTFRL